MTEPSPELEQRVRQAFARMHSERVFVDCKIAEDGGDIVVRLYSQRREEPKLMPTPYEVFRFDPIAGTLTPLTGADAAPYLIPQYK